jgi:hypothetical protein
MLETGYVATLLVPRDDPKSKIDNSHFYFYAILHFISEQSDDFKQPTDLLTQREEYLLSVSTSIAYCPSGHREGIDLYYCGGFLPDKYRCLEKELEATGPEKVGLLIDRTVQSLLKINFMKESLIKDLIRERIKSLPEAERKEALEKLESLSQMPHQAQYAKNRFALQAGLEHSLAFDAHVGVLNPLLLDVTPEQFLRVLFKYFTVQEVFDGVKKVFAELLKDAKSQFYHNLRETLEVHPDLYKNISKYFVLDEDEIAMNVQDWVIVDLLIQVGYWREVGI